MIFRTLPLIFFLFLLNSCSLYQKVSLENHANTGISNSEHEGTHYVLKRHQLLYSRTEKRYIINNFNGDEAAAYESQRMNVEDHVMIPRGASGVCINQQGNQIFIDFGKGVVIPFSLLGEKNYPNKDLLLNGIQYSLVERRRQGQLYYNGKSL